jgi:hypothetical protein
MTALHAARWHAQRFLREGGLPAWAALALLAATATAWLVLRPPAESELAALRGEIAELARPAAAKARTPLTSAQAEAASIAELERRFAGPASIASAVQRLERSAQRHGVISTGASFRLDEPAGQPLARYTMDWPVRAEYRALRGFIAEALREQPALALEGLSLQRDPEQPTLLNVRLRWVYFFAPGT